MYNISVFESRHSVNNVPPPKLYRAALQTAVQNGIELKFQASPSLHKSDSQIAFVVSRVNHKTFLSFPFLFFIFNFLPIEIQTRKIEKITGKILL